MATDATPGPGGARLIGSSRLVGRERETAALREALARPPALVVVEGEAGVGKSRLLGEFFASPDARQVRVLVAQCPPFRVAYTLAPVVDAVRGATDHVGSLRLSALAGALRPLFPEWADDLPPPPDPLEDAGAARCPSERGDTQAATTRRSAMPTGCRAAGPGAIGQAAALRGAAVPSS